jgi:hypothetical protein
MSAQKWTVKGLTTLAVLVGVFLFLAGQAHASLGEFTFVSSFGSTAGQGIAVDESTGDVYVYTGGAISKFDADGNPVNFSALGSNQITGVQAGGSGETQMAVDNSTGPAKGDIYLAGSFSGVKIFGSDGKALGTLTETGGVPWGEVACGVAVDPTGRVYVGVYPSNVNEYVPAANPVTNSNYTKSIAGVNEVCNVAVDPEGSVYVDTWAPFGGGPIFKYAAQAGQSKQVVEKGGVTLAVADSPSAELFVDRTGIQQYDSSGNLLSTFGTGSIGLAINPKNGRLYASNGEVEIWQGVIVPAVQTGQATSLDPAGNATLNGSVAPEGATVETCSFQYGTSVSYGSVVACAQATPLTGTSTLPVSAGVTGLLPNHTYHYRLSTTDEHGTINGSDHTFIILVSPTVEDQLPTVSSIARASATLTGTVNPEQAETSYHFEYGTTESYENSAPGGHTGNGAVDIEVSRQLNELLPNTIYHYRLVASNLAGTTFGADHTFTTGAPTPPAAVTGGSSGVAQNAATIIGAVNTNGLPTSYGFEIGTSTDYGPRTGLGAVGAGGSEIPVSLSLTGLLPGTTYHYRITATNIDGTSYGADQTFTTTTFANTFAEPPAPLPFVSVPQIAFPPESKSGSVKKRTGKAKGKKVKKHGKARGKKKSKTKKK